MVIIGILPWMEKPGGLQSMGSRRVGLSNFTFTFHFHALEKAMATHSSVLAWRIPGTGEPGGLPSTGSHRVRHDWSDLAAAAEPWQKGRGKWEWRGTVTFTLSAVSVCCNKYLLNSHKKFLSYIFKSSLFYKWGNWGPERWSHLAQVHRKWSGACKTKAALFSGPKLGYNYNAGHCARCKTNESACLCVYEHTFVYITRASKYWKKYVVVFFFLALPLPLPSGFFFFFFFLASFLLQWGWVGCRKTANYKVVQTLPL